MIYIFLFLLLLSQVFVFDFLGYKVGRKFWWSADLFLLILIAGLRWEVGGDSLSYQDAFENKLASLQDFFSSSIFTEGWEPGFVFLMAFCKWIYNEFWFFQIVQATIVNVIIFSFLKKYTTFNFLSVFIYFIFNYLYFNTEVLREALAVSVFIYMYEALRSNKLKKYYFLNLIAILFHYSALILLVFPLLSKLKLNSKNIGLFLLFGAFFPQLLKIIQVFLSFLPFADRVLAKLDVYLIYNLNINGTIFNFICFVVFPILLIKSIRYKDVFKDLEILYMPYLFVAMIFVIHSGFGRFINYFIPFMMVGFSQFIYMLATYNRFRQVKVFLILLVLLPPFVYKFSYYNRSTSDLYPDTKVLNRWYPYSSILTKESYYFRRVLYQEGMKQSHNRARKNQ